MGNPGDKPGYKVLTIGDSDSKATDELNELSDAGYRVLFALSDCAGDGSTTHTRVILGNYTS